jgi:hypothetical protein
MTSYHEQIGAMSTSTSTYHARASSAFLRQWADRWHAARIIRRRNANSIFASPGIYISLSVVFGIGAVTLDNALHFTERNAVLVTIEPLLLPITIVVTLMSLYLGLNAGLAVSREYERSTLEILFYGPVDAVAFLAGIFLAQSGIYLQVAVLTFIWANVATWLLNLAFSFIPLAALVGSVAPVAMVIALALLASVVGRRRRTSLISFLLIILLALVLEVAQQVVSSIPEQATASQNDPLLLIRSALASLTSVAQWISPYAQLNAAQEALLEGDSMVFALHVAVTAMEAVLLVVASAVILQRKGVRS